MLLWCSWDAFTCAVVVDVMDGADWIRLQTVFVKIASGHLGACG